MAAQELVGPYIEAVTVLEDAVELKLAPTPGAAGASQPRQTVSIPWSKQPAAAIKGVAHEPHGVARGDPKAGEAVLIAIAKARVWLDELVNRRSLKEIAAREGEGDRQIRLLLPLAFVAPQTVRRLIDGVAPIPTPTDLAKASRSFWPAYGTQWSFLPKADMG